VEVDPRGPTRLLISGSVSAGVSPHVPEFGVEVGITSVRVNGMSGRARDPTPPSVVGNSYGKMAVRARLATRTRRSYIAYG
jgi:hypothetical protein